ELPREEREREKPVTSGAEEPPFAGQDRGGSRSDPEPACHLRGGVPAGLLASDRLRRELDPHSPARDPRRDEEVVQDRAGRQRLDRIAARGVDRAVGAEADAEPPLRFLDPRLAVPEDRLGILSPRRFENEPPADRADARIRERPEELADGAGIE